MLWISVVRLLRTNYSALHRMSSSNLSTTTATMSPTLHDGGEEDGLGGLLCDEARRSRSGRLLLAVSSDNAIGIEDVFVKLYGKYHLAVSVTLSKGIRSRVFLPLRDCFNILSFKPLDSLLVELSLSCFAGPNLRFFAFPSDSNSWSSDLEVINAIRCIHGIKTWKSMNIQYKDVAINGNKDIIQAEQWTVIFQKLLQFWAAEL